MTCSANVVGAGGSLRSESGNGRRLYPTIDFTLIWQTMGAISGSAPRPRRLAHVLDVEIGGDGMGRLCKSAGSWRLCE
jgi:hypothetical protein